MSKSTRWFSRTGVLLSGMLLLVLLILGAGAAAPVAANSVVAFDMVGGASQNLNSYTNVWQTGFTAVSDGFQKYQRGVSTAIPYQILDDSLTFPADNAGIIRDGNTAPFFGVTDTENPDNAGAVTAVWSFDISGASNLGLSINMGAMGDFEANDTFTWTYQIDGGAVQTAFASTVDENASLTYILESGSAFTLDDPMLVGSVILSNDLQTLTTPLSGSGSTLLLTLTASTDSGTEAFAFQDIVISGDNAPPPVAQIVITEIMQNPSAVNDSAGEWFELYNAGADPVDIDGWTIKDDGYDSHVINNGGPLMVPAGGYLVLGNNSNSLTNGGVTVAYQYPDNWYLGNGEDEVVLLDGLTEVDRVNYDDGATFPDPNGASMALSDLTLDNNVGANWCTAGTVYGAGDLGTPGAANDCTPVGGPPQIVISEIMNDPSAVNDSAGEWFEIYNAGAMAVDINGWTIKDDGSDSHVINSGGPLMVPAGGYLVLGNNSDSGTNGGATVAYQYPSNWYLSNGADEVVLLDGTLTEIDRVNYDGGATFPDPTGASMSLSDLTLDNNVGASWCTSTTTFGAGDKGTPGAANNCDVVVPPALSCTDSSAITLISAVQGSGLSSPLLNNTVTIDGVVVGDFQNNASADDGDLNGFYVQEEDAEADANALTSEGVFVYAPGGADVSTGDHVRVRGTVAEYVTSSGASSLTQLKDVEVAICAAPALAPAVTAVTLPLTAPGDLEAVEGMLVTFPQELSISEYFNFDRYNEIVLSLGRQFQPTAVAEPGSPAAANLATANALARILLDDGRSSQNSDPALHPNGLPFDLSNLFRGGDTVQNATGVIDDTFGVYRLQPTEGATYMVANPRPATPEDVGGSLTVASFNVLNYFTTLDTGSPICGPSASLDCRGANNAEEFTRQRDKIIAAISTIDADVVGLLEIENNVNDDAVIDLVAGLNALMGAGTYDYVATGPVGTDAIKVALIYKPATVTLDGGYAILDSSVDARFLDDKNRPAVAQTFTENASGAGLTVAVNHLKSKGSSCDSIGDPDLGDGAGNCNLTRKAAAQALVDWLATDPTGSGEVDNLIIGDLNSYDKEDPIDVILAGADDTAGTTDDYTDLLRQFQGENAYSYVFDGALGYLDYALANNSLLPQVTGTTAWHINADEPDILDYNTDFKQPAQDALYEPNAYRASDHDPVIVGLNLNSAPLCVAAQPSTEVIWPPNHKMFPVTIQGVTDPDNDPFVISISSIFQDEPVNEKGDGNSGPDGAGIGTNTADLRAERSGKGNGRAYHVYFNAQDAFGASCNGEVVVFVPKNQNKWGPRIDDGPLYDSTQN